jgi:excinuclease UvrABC ATPase subunit
VFATQLEADPECASLFNKFGWPSHKKVAQDVLQGIYRKSSEKWKEKKREHVQIRKALQKKVSCSSCPACAQLLTRLTSATPIAQMNLWTSLQMVMRLRLVP